MKITIIWRYMLGIDISKNTLDLYLLDRKTQTGHERQVSNSQQGFEHLAEWLEAWGAGKSQTKLVSEHTGRYGEHLLRWTTETNWAHAVVKTTALQKVSKEHHCKTDEVDAEGLAEYGDRFSDRLPLTEAPKPAVGQIKRLQAERRKMVSRRAALKSKLSEADFHNADMERLTNMWRQHVQLLSKHIDELEASISELIETDSALSRYSRIMRTAPGMGKVLTPLWLSLHAGQQTLSARRISSRFGFAPHPHQSGSSVHQPDRSSGFGNSEMRKVLHQAALSVSTHHPHYQAYYKRKRAEGKEHKLVINNIINKLIRMYCAMWNNQAKYNPDHIRKMKKKYPKTA